MRSIPPVLVIVLYFLGAAACSSTINRRCSFATKGGAQCIWLGARTSTPAQPDSGVDADAGDGRDRP